MEPNAPLDTDPGTKNHNQIMRVLGEHGGLGPVVKPPQYPLGAGDHHPGLTPNSNMACEMVK